MGHVIVGWIIGVGGLGLYALSVFLRGRRLAPQVPPERQRWMNVDD